MALAIETPLHQENQVNNRNTTTRCELLRVTINLETLRVVLSM